MLKVVHFQRRPAPGQVSIERVFADIRAALPPHIHCSVHRSPCFSRGILPRMANLAHATNAAGAINHIVGDVHYLALAMPPSRTMLTIHDCVSLERLRGPKHTLFRWLWYVLPLRAAAFVSVVSESAKCELLRHVRCDPAKIQVIHNCVGSEFVPHIRPPSKTDPVLLQVGTRPNKNLTRIAAALSGIPCIIKIIGRLTAEQERQLQHRRLRFENLPYASGPELIQAYRDADIVLFASTYEGFGLPILEANATGRPVITSRLFSMPEVAGPAACYVDPYDVNAIRSAALRLLTDAPYRRRLVAAGFENVKRFAAPLIAARYAEAYQQIICAARQGSAAEDPSAFAFRYAASLMRFRRFAMRSLSSPFRCFGPVMAPTETRVRSVAQIQRLA